MTVIPSADELMATIAKARAEKLAAAEKQHEAEQKKKEALLEVLRKPSGFSDEQLLEKASILIEHAVSRGDTAVEVFRFPHAVCTDGGRALNQGEPGWEKTLVGEPKEIYDLWERKLKSKGYHLRYEIVDYPDGMPGNVAVTLSWQGTQQQ